MNKRKPKISVIIPTYNSWITLEPCILSIIEQTIHPIEILVVDNGSTDGTAHNLRKVFPRVKVFVLDKNTGVTGGRNMGIVMSNPQSEFVFFFDHDMVADRRMLEELWKACRLGSKVGVVTPKIYYWTDKKRIWSAGTGMNLLTGRVLFRGGKDIGQYESPEEVQVAPAAIFVKREVVNKLKKFDNRYFAIYEDTDFCFRARKKGYATYYAPRAIAYHKISFDSKDEADRLLSRAYYVGRNRILFMRDFGENFLVFSLFIPLYSVYYLRLALKYRRFKDWLSYSRGIIDGILGV